MNETAGGGIISGFAELRRLCVDVLEELGVSSLDARTVADALVSTDACGVNTHGVKLLGGYVRRLKAGGLRARGAPKIIREGPAWAIVDGDSSLGAVASVFAMRTAMAKAKQNGIGYVGVNNSCHFGAAGYYAAMAASENMIGIAMANDIPSVGAPGARGRITGSNPLAYAVPTATPGRPILLDMAVSTVAGGKVGAAHALGKAIPGHWLLDTDGRPSTDPADFAAGGALTPMAAHKGYGIALLIESLSGLLTGAATTWQVLAWMVHDPSKPTGHGAAFLAFDIAAMMPLEQFLDRADALCAEIRSSPKAPGAERIYLPGEIEWDQRDKALARGIPLPADVVESLRKLADEVGLDLKKYLPTV